MSNSFGYSDSVQALRSYTTQTADKSMAGFTRLLNSTLNNQSGLQSTDSHLNQMSSNLNSSNNQTLSSSFGNEETASIQTALSLSSTSSAKDDSGPKALPRSSATSANLDSKLTMSPPSSDSNSSVTQRGFEKLRQNILNGGASESFSPALNGKIQNSQQLLDTVTQQNTSSNSLQRQEAYKSLLAATRQIAETTSDTGIRNAAQNFELQLTRAYQFGNRMNFEQKSNRNASSEVGYVSNQDLRTMMDSSPTAMQKAIETFGSAEAAQNALFHSPAARSFFARELHKELNQSDWNEGQVKPLSTVDIDTMARPHRRDFEAEVTSRFDDSVSANRLDLQTAQQNAIGKRSVSKAPNFEPVRQSVHQERTAFRTDRETLQAELMQERGEIMSAKAVYEEKQSGVPTVLSNAFLGGVLYSSPQEYKDKFSEKAESSANFAKALQSVGNNNEVKLRDLEHSSQAKSMDRSND